MCTLLKIVPLNFFLLTVAPRVHLHREQVLPGLLPRLEEPPRRGCSESGSCGDRGQQSCGRALLCVRVSAHVARGGPKLGFVQKIPFWQVELFGLCCLRTFILVRCLHSYGIAIL